MCMHILLVSFQFTPRSTAFESFRRGVFDLLDFEFVHFLK